MRKPPLTFGRFVCGPENRAALAAAQWLAEQFVSGRAPAEANPLYLHGPPGTGKTHLVSALLDDVTRRRPQVVAQVVTASDVRAGSELGSIQQSTDLLIIEDLQHLPRHTAEALVQLIDQRQAHRQQLVLTAASGPQQLSQGKEPVSSRLASRLGSGLVVGLCTLQAATRLALLRDKAQRRQLAVSGEVLAWVAEHVSGGGRQLEGAVTQLEMLSKTARRAPGMAEVAAHFHAQAEASRVTVERIAEHVGCFFRVAPRHLQSRRRSRNILVPRQVGMYLARQLTNLSLSRIGAYFGGRDHSTVLHACRKVEQTALRDPTLSGAVRQLHAELA